MKNQRVFVYGTLMTGLRNHYLIKAHLKEVQAGKTNGILYDLPYGYPAMVPGNGTVYGELMELSEIEEALSVLDGLEDYFGVGCPDNLYNRVHQEVETTGGEKLMSYLYIWARPDELMRRGTLVPDGDWRRFKGF